MCGWPPTCKSYFREEHWSLAVMCPAFGAVAHVMVGFSDTGYLAQRG
jgi:hypothetical protein